MAADLRLGRHLLCISEALGSVACNTHSKAHVAGLVHMSAGESSLGKCSDLPLQLQHCFREVTILQVAWTVINRQETMQEVLVNVEKTP